MQNIADNKNAFTCPNDLTIITCRNKGTLEDRIIDSLKGYEHKSILETNLEYLGIDNLEILTDSRLPWRCTFKIEMINNYLPECKTKYILFCDAIDVIFIADPQEVLDIFYRSKCNMLFMSTKTSDGYSCMPDIYRWACDINKGRFLNSGVWVGETKFVGEVFIEAGKYIKPHGVTMGGYKAYLDSKPINYPIGSQDQDIFRFIEPKFYPKLRVDCKNLMAFRS